MGKKIEVNVSCPHCGNSLMDKSYLINNSNSIFLNINVKDSRKGRIWLSSIYGDFNYTCDIPIAEDSIVNFFCPHCNKDLKRKKVECDYCTAPMVSFNCKVGGRISICSRQGCKNHYVVFENPDMVAQKFYTEYGYH